MIGKVSKGILKTLAFCMGLWIIIYAAVTTAEEFLHDYNVFDTIEQPAVVTEKFSKKGLITSPSYFVRVDLNEQNASEDIENRVSAWQFKRLKVGDSIKGHYIHGEHFFTTLDVIIDSIILFIFFLVFLLLTVLLICWPIFAFIEHRKKKNKLPQVIKAIYRKKREHKKKNFRKKKYLFQKFSRKVLLPIIIVTALLSISGFLMNSILKFSPIGKTTTEAIIIDSESYDREFYGSHYMTDPYYAFEILFKDEKQEAYKVKKEVTQNVYRKHVVGDTIKISYLNVNPYNVFVPNYSLFSIFEIVFYGRFMLCNIILTCLLLYFFMKFKKRKRK